MQSYFLYNCGIMNSLSIKCGSKRRSRVRNPFTREVTRSATNLFLTGIAVAGVLVAVKAFPFVPEVPKLFLKQTPLVEQIEGKKEVPLSSAKELVESPQEGLVIQVCKNNNCREAIKSDVQLTELRQSEHDSNARSLNILVVALISIFAWAGLIRKPKESIFPELKPKPV